MKIDIDYISRLLNVFLEAQTSHISILDFPKADIPIETEDELVNEEFLFHIQIALENGLMSDRDMKIDGLKTIGLHLMGNGGLTIAIKPIRLTQKGHDFALALQNKEVLTRLKTELKNAPFKTLFDGSQKLLEHFLTKKLDKLLE